MNTTINLFREFFQEIGAGKEFEIERSMSRGLKSAGQNRAKAHRKRRVVK
jgi:hypothetical protein